MKKRVFAVAIAFMLLLSSISTAAYASDGFNKAVFDNAPDVFVVKDDMTGDLSAASDSLLGDKGVAIPESGGGYVVVYSGVAISDTINANSLLFKYYANHWAFIDSVIIKVGKRRYRFDEISVNREVLSDASISEAAFIDLTSDVIPFMTYLIEHRDETVKVRLQGENRDIDFVLTDDMKNGIINIYNLFVAGGGTNKASIQKMNAASKIVVTVGQD